MKNKDVFKIWAPTEARWTQWVRPVPFVAINNDYKIYNLGNFVIPKINYINSLFSNVAIIIDLPGNDGIKEGIAVAKLGYRPIPIYNGTNEQEGAIATVDNHLIEIGLIKGALELEKIEISNDAPPVFLLDSNRTNRFKMNVSVFDNSWDIYPQDIPSAEYFKEKGINRIIVRGEKVQKDLSKILYKFQEKGIVIFFTNGYEVPKKITIRKQIIEKND